MLQPFRTRTTRFPTRAGYRDRGRPRPLAIHGDNRYVVDPSPPRRLQRCCSATRDHRPRRSLDPTGAGCRPAFRPNVVSAGQTVCSTVGDRTYPDMTGADLRGLSCNRGDVSFAPPSRLSRPSYSSRSTRTVVTRKNRNSFFTRRNGFRRMPRYAPSDNAARRHVPSVLRPYS